MMKKTTLAAAVVLGLTLSASAFATDITPGPTQQANNLAPETNPTAPVSLSDVGATGAWDITAKSGYALSGTEFRAVRIQCQNATIDATKVAASYTSAGGPTVGLPNQAGANAVVFSVTQGAANGAATDAVRLHPTSAGGIKLTTLGNAYCSYSMYDSPSTAIAGGTTGLIYTTGNVPYLTFGPSLSVTAAGQNTLYTDYTTTPTFAMFSRGVPGGLISGTVGETANFTFGLNPSYDKDGNAITMATALTNAQFKLHPGSGTVAAGLAVGSTVKLTDDASCAAGNVIATVNNTTGVGAIANTAVAGTPYYLCYTVPGNKSIPDGLWTADVLSASAATNGLQAGAIHKDGSTLQATLAQNPAGYVSRIVVTNMGAADAPYSIDMIGENGQSMGVATGTALAGRMTTIPLTMDMSTVSSATRSTINLFVSGGHDNIKAMYQIVNPSSGSVSNTQMINIDQGVSPGFALPVF